MPVKKNIPPPPPVTEDNQAEFDKIDKLFEDDDMEVDAFLEEKPIERTGPKEHFIITADWHSGLLRYSRDTREGVPERHKELLNSIGAIFKYAYDTKAAFVAVLGDIFDNNHPSQLFYSDLIPIFRQVSEWGIPVYLFPGNHDAINTIREMNALRTILKSKFNNIIVIDKVSAVSDALPGSELLFIPHINRCEYSVFDKEAEKRLILEKVQELKLDKKKKCIVFGHAAVPNSIQGAERLIMRGGEQTFDIEINAVAYFFGHMHTPQEGKYKGIPYYYPGSIQAIDFSERNDEKSFIDVSLVANKMMEVKRIAVPTRKLIQIDISNYDEYLAEFECDTHLSKSYEDLKDKIVKVKIEIPADQKIQINEDKINKQCKDAYWLDIDYHLQRDVATRNKEVTADADPDTAFSEWYKAKQYPEKEFKEILKLHSDIMVKATTVKE